MQAHVLTNIADMWFAMGDAQAARHACQEALVILNDLDPSEAARLRAKRDAMGS